MEACLNDKGREGSDLGQSARHRTLKATDEASAVHTSANNLIDLIMGTNKQPHMRHTLLKDMSLNNRFQGYTISPPRTEVDKSLKHIFIFALWAQKLSGGRGQTQLYARRSPRRASDGNELRKLSEQTVC